MPATVHNIPAATEKLQHGIEQLKPYQTSRQLLINAYALTHGLPVEEKNNFTSYIRSAALHIHVCIIKGLLKKSKKKYRQFSKALSSLVILETAVGILQELEYIDANQAREISLLTQELNHLLKVH